MCGGAPWGVGEGTGLEEPSLDMLAGGKYLSRAISCQPIYRAVPMLALWAQPAAQARPYIVPVPALALYRHHARAKLVPCFFGMGPCRLIVLAHLDIYTVQQEEYKHTWQRLYI